jgi:hypothetical protein
MKMTDIVETLREHATLPEKKYPLLNRAADEIERLRAEKDDLLEAFQEILNIGIRVGNAALKRDDQK